MNLSVFVPCSVDQFSPNTASNLIRLLEKLGYSPEYNPEQTCCGRVLYDNGSWKEAKEVGEGFLNLFQGSDYIIGCSTNCIGYIKNDMGNLFFNTSLHNYQKNVADRTMDISEFLVDYIKVLDIGAHFPYKVHIHYNCRARNEYNIEEEIRLLLENVEGLEITNTCSDGFCCGYGGLFTLFNEPVSMALAKKKVESAIAEGADYIVSSDLSCLLHVQSYIDKHGIDLKTIHIIDLLMWEEDNNLEE